MKSIDSYLCRNQKQPVIAVYNINTGDAEMSDGSRRKIHFPKRTSLEIYDLLAAQNPKVQVIAEWNDGYWPIRLFGLLLFGWIIYKGLSN